MTIGILTFYKVCNFGANLQALSTYSYLKQNGHEPIMIDYQSVFTENEWNKAKLTTQGQVHDSFLELNLPRQTRVCHNLEELNRVIEYYSIESIIIGSDAVVQHHPLRDRIKKGRRRPFYIEHCRPESMFPNLFWGIGFSSKIPCSMLSVSSQNSEYSHFSRKTRAGMKACLSNLKYISVRDTWTQSMFEEFGFKVDVTPDPVFAFNYNCGDIVPSKEEILEKHKIPSNYILVSLHDQSLSEEALRELKSGFERNDLQCVAFPMPKGVNFKHNFDYEVTTPLSPIDWYALIKNARGYVGSNMHPIIVSLHNSVPCFSIDHWGTTDFWGRRRDDGSSKVEHILGTYNLAQNRVPINYKSENLVDNIIQKIVDFPIDKVSQISLLKYKKYEEMMCKILDAIKK